VANSVNGTLKPEVLLRRLEEEIDQAFCKVEETFSPRVTCLFKGVQYETITGDAHFRKQVEDYFGEEEAAQLLFEYDASRAEEPTRA
jgi:hypothetical protein